MSTYLYKATDGSGKVVNGSLEADGEKGVVSELHNMGLIPIRITLSKGGAKRFDTDVVKQIASFFNGVSSKDTLGFTQDLSTLLASGLPVDRALSILIGAAEKEKVKEVVGDYPQDRSGGRVSVGCHGQTPENFFKVLCEHGEGAAKPAVSWRLF